MSARSERGAVGEKAAQRQASGERVSERVRASQDEGAAETHSALAREDALGVGRVRLMRVHKVSKRASSDHSEVSECVGVRASGRARASQDVGAADTHGALGRAKVLRIGRVRLCACTRFQSEQAASIRR